MFQDGDENNPLILSKHVECQGAYLSKHISEEESHGTYEQISLELHQTCHTDAAGKFIESHGLNLLT